MKVYCGKQRYYYDVCGGTTSVSTAGMVGNMATVEIKSLERYPNALRESNLSLYGVEKDTTGTNIIFTRGQNTKTH